MKYLTLLSLAAASFLIPADPLHAAEAPPAEGGKQAGPHRDGRRLEPAERLKAVAEKLGLTEEQSTKVKAIFETNRDKYRQLRDLPPEERRAKMRELRTSEMDEIKAILAPEQQEKAKEMWKERREGRGGDKPAKP